MPVHNCCLKIHRNFHREFSQDLLTEFLTSNSTYFSVTPKNFQVFSSAAQTEQSRGSLAKPAFSPRIWAVREPKWVGLGPPVAQNEPS